jgi:predicted MFS family arabinose efflux permease
VAGISKQIDARHPRHGFTVRVKAGAFVVEGVNAAATSLFFNYFFFIMRDQFGFTNLGNLFLCAVNGAVYCVSVLYAGRFAQRRGYLVALRRGVLIMGGALLLGSGVISKATNQVMAQLALMVVWTGGMSLTWPALEAITSEGEPPARLQRLLGIYNLVWAGCSALAYFGGGALLERWGHRSIFLVPAALHGCQWAIVWWLQREDRLRPIAVSECVPVPALPSHETERRRSPVPAARFLRMAWVANPFAYIAVNALVPVIPKLAERLGLGPMLAGFFCSTWLFARAGSFLVLWLWTAWHYRFRWLVGAYVAMSVCFVIILLGHSLGVLLLAQVVFGSAVGLLYYSSLYYSMDVGETKGEHGGFHEAAIGAGICIGPAVGAGSLVALPGWPNMNTWAVAGLLAAGLGWLMTLRRVRTAEKPGESRLEG